MPTFMVQASYTSPAWNKLVQRPENRMEALRPVVEKLGGEIIAAIGTGRGYHQEHRRQYRKPGSEQARSRGI